MKVKIALWIALLSLAGAARGQTTFTITGTATNLGNATATSFGYGLGNSYTFTFTSGATVPNNANSAFTVSSNTWNDYHSMGDGSIFTSVTGNGLNSSYSPAADQVSQVYAAGQIFQIFLGSESGTSYLGLSTPNTTLVPSISVYINRVNNLAPNPYATPGSYTDLPTYFSSYAGDYTIFPDGANTKLTVYNGGSGSVVFTITHLVITSAIPEPAEYAALAGLASLGLVTWQRRRKSGPQTQCSRG